MTRSNYIAVYSFNILCCFFVDFVLQWVSQQNHLEQRAQVLRTPDCGCEEAFTQQQVDQDLLARQRVAPGQTHNGANDPRDAVARERQQGDHGAAASPGGGRVGAHPHALGQADVDGEQGVHGDPLEGGVELHAVLLGHPAGLLLVPAAAVGRFLTRLARLMLELGRPPSAASARAAAAAAATAAAAAATAAAPTAVEGLGVQGNKLGSAQDAVPLPRPGSPRRHVEDQTESSSAASTIGSRSPRKTIQVVRVYHGMKCPRISHLQQTSPHPLFSSSGPNRYI